MNLLHRWGLAVPLTILSLLFLGASVLNISMYWSSDTTAQHIWTSIITGLFAVSTGLSISVGIGHRDSEIPWLRVGIVVVVMLLGCGALLIRRTLY